ncbi:MAG: ATPase [Gammaproteobacteria bacterium HGW-Gammaproteobacteria-3]|nr:MAG: ATPase [Gammaproteobacteria bacterium HGW-Gammaproteobacteria-3]
MTPDDLQQRLAQAGYIADRSMAATLSLFVALQRPLLLEGDAGVGKTEVACALARIFACRLLRLQCYEGLDVNAAVYEWNYQHQLLAIKMLEQGKVNPESAEQQIFSDKYLLQRPLLQAIRQPVSPVLLIDEIDRADEEFEAFLLEVLSDFQISVPELGTLGAISIPYVVLTSNGTRELSDALRRRCLYYYVEYPGFDKELRIVTTRLPEIGLQLARQVVAFVQSLRKTDLRKNPGISETLDWAAALLRLNVSSLDNDIEAVTDSLVCLLKTHEDSGLAPDEVKRLIARAV